MTLRKHQRDFSSLIDRIAASGHPRAIIAHVTPGGGKSTLPIIATRLLKADLADRLAWIVPRASLQDQAERNFTDPFFRRMFNHCRVIRSATNNPNPCRGTDGFVTTYQALPLDKEKTVLRDFERHRYILVLDEFHHCADCGDWTEPIAELYEKAAFRVLMTGTMARGDGNKIAFLNYRPIGEDEWEPIPDADTALIRYSRADALADRAIIPLEFHFAEGVAEWRKESGKVARAHLSDPRHDANQALYTALRTEYAEQLLTAGVNHWQARRSVNPSGSLLVVAANIESAKEYTEILKRQGLHVEIATSDDTPAAVKAIKALKAGKLKVLMSVAMAYEGLDVPSISHIACLTNVRSKPWIEQMVARAVRIDPLAGPYESQRGFIFAPADRMFQELAARIEADQQEAVARVKVAGQRGNGNGNGGEARPGITPLSSRMIDRGQFETGSLFSEANPPFYETMGAISEKTQREIETELRERINAYVLDHSRLYSHHPGLLNRMLRDRFNKCRDHMSVGELEAVMAWLEQTHPIPQRRESGIVLEPVRVGR